MLIPKKKWFLKDKNEYFGPKKWNELWIALLFTNGLQQINHFVPHNSCRNVYKRSFDGVVVVVPFILHRDTATQTTTSKVMSRFQWYMLNRILISFEIVLRCARSYDTMSAIMTFKNTEANNLHILQIFDSHLNGLINYWICMNLKNWGAINCR